MPSEKIKRILRARTDLPDEQIDQMSDKEMDEFSMVELKQFCEAVEEKIISFQEDDYYKEVPNLSDWQPPKPSQCRKVNELESKNLKTKKTLLKDISATTSSKDIPQETLDTLTKMNEDLKAIVFEISSVKNIDKLSKWEKDFLLAQTSDAIKGFDNSFLGKPSKNS